MAKRKKADTTYDPAQLETDRQAVRMLVRLRDDFQQMRKRTDNRIGRKADGSSQNIDERQFRVEDLENFAAVADNGRDQEKLIEKMLLNTLKRFPVYNHFLAHASGVGAIAAGWIVGEFDIHRATTVSKMWQFAGMNPGLVRGKKRKQHADGSFELILTDKMIPGDKLTPGFVAPFNKRLRTALLGVMGDGFLKAGIRGEDVDEATYEATPDTYRRMKGKQHQRLHAITPAAELYLTHKHRLANSVQMTTEVLKGGKVKQVAWKDAKPAHRHRACIRYMVKMWILDLYKAWREIEGLPVRPPYQEEYLGHKHDAA